MEKLGKYEAVLAGTIPLNIDIATSDLDILCCFENELEFEQTLRECFGQMNHFTIRKTSIRGELSIIAGFHADGFEIEIFGQRRAVKDQLGYRHMMIEYKLLAERGEDFREKIIQMKLEGMKTEPAFASVMGLTGDPYTALLQFE